MLGRRDVGHRIVVRRIVGNQSGRTLFSDALGELVDLTETHLTLATANGPLRVPLREVHRAKRVPPGRRPNAAAVVELELASDEAWPAPVRERLGDWLLRTADGWSGRANTALPVGDPDRPLDEAIDAVQRWYAARGRPAMVNVPLPLAAPVGAALDERGWSARPLVLVQTAPLATILDAIPARPDLPVPKLAGTPSPEWFAVAAERKAKQGRQYARLDSAATGPPGGAGRSPDPGAPAGLPAAARHILTAVRQVRFAHLSATPSGEHTGGGPELIAVARGTVTGQHRWLGLSLIEVVPSARRQGLAQHLIRALAEWAAGLGATRAFLQVEEHNEAAVSLYRRLGFTTHHTYQTRVAPH
ncbi:GNAT family N-acetyltransferase [Plantactinospora sp. KLBMP9567]|uniref:GNAT family N-acetyltransferase n=1 Tax=Plantactinospora sp. KLBMP9567 TaxID=3085900 RepID=UPI002981605A|nr:GNAT family N-acetyltransferase [Plantactinospora sp. KLBMP9567]MDW5326254.1 GNAT family N-acetyltransferase [Plantactinospora sp. KLBMP9567]MDW5330822.1 GNAT family N-acetyltransferase [Plantactinospora sp. KLBMP9567]